MQWKQMALLLAVSLGAGFFWGQDWGRKHPHINTVVITEPHLEFYTSEKTAGIVLTDRHGKVWQFAGASNLPNHPPCVIGGGAGMHDCMISDHVPPTE